MERANIPFEKALTNEQVINFYLNVLRDRVISRSLDLTHYLRVQKIDPAFELNGKKVADLIDIERAAIIYARENLRTLEHFMELEKVGNFEAMWEDEALLSEIEKYQKMKSEEATGEQESK